MTSEELDEFDESRRVIIIDINMETFIPLGINPDEVIANALRESGLLAKDTKINEKNPIELCSSFLEKKSNYQQLTKLGNLLVKNKVITLSQLKEALYEQQQNSAMKLGNILIGIGACSKWDIEKCVKSQNQIRDDIKKLDEYEDKIGNLRKRLSSGRSSTDKL